MAVVEEKPVALIRVQFPSINGHPSFVSSDDLYRIRQRLVDADLPFKFLIMSADIEFMGRQALQEFADKFQKAVESLKE